MRYVIPFTILILTACAPLQYENAGSQNRFQDDKYDCELALGYRGHAGGNQPTDQLFDKMVRGREEMRRCLERKGWRVAQSQ